MNPTVIQSNETNTPAVAKPVAEAPVGYELLDEVGRGGMGIVYRARDLSLARDVALKFLHEKHAPDSSTAARFVEEARITAQLQHPGIPAVYQVGALPDGRPFLAMKLIKGQTLDFLLKAKAPFDPLAVFEATAQAVGYAHAHGVIHRDLKPANIMVGSFGEVQVMDWGLAKVLGSRPQDERRNAPDQEVTIMRSEIRTQRDSETPFTQYGSVLGTPAYMAPEQAAGELDKVDCRSDVFGLGAILCVLLTQEPPFTGRDPDAVRIAAVRGNTEEAFARLDASGAERDAIALCKRCLAFDPSARPATANEVAAAVAALRQAADERARQAEQDRMAAEVQAAEQVKRRRLTLWAASAVAAVLLLGIAGTIVGLMREKDAHELAVRKQKEAEAERDQKEKARVAEQAAKQKAIDAQKTAEQKRKEAERAQEVASQQRRLALNTVRDVLLRVDHLMKNDVRLVPLRLEIIQRMLSDVDRIRDHALKNPLEDRTEALAFTRIGEIYFKASRIEDAALWLNKAYAVIARAAKEAPEDPNALRNLAAAAHLCADAEWRLGNGSRARDLDAQGLDVRRKWLALVRKGGQPIEVASAEHDVAESLSKVAYSDLRMGDPVSAIESYTASEKAFEALPPPLPNFLNVRRTRNEIKVRLGYARSSLGQLEAAEKHYREALADREKLVTIARSPSATVTHLKTDVGQSRMFVGDFLLMFRKDRKAAHLEYTAAAEIFSALLKDEPDNLDLRQRMSATHYRLGLAAADSKQAKKAFEDCLKMRKEAAEIDPKDMQSGIEVAIALARTGAHDEAEREAAYLLREAGKDRQVLFQVACTLSIVAGTTTDRRRADRCRDRAFEVLRDLVKAGWKDRAGLETDPDLDFIRAEPRFKELLKTVPKPAEIPPPPQRPG
jgi:tetratricopeptide (TPR) repeat protein